MVLVEKFWWERFSGKGLVGKAWWTVEKVGKGSVGK